MRIGFIGAGKVGFTLGKYMSEHDVHVSGFLSRSKESAKAASKFTHTEYFDTLEEIAKISDALFLSVPDDAIESVWNLLKSLRIAGKCICHTSGVKSSTVFTGIENTGAFGYSIHPLFAICSRENSYREISNATFTIEGDEKYLSFWEELFEGFGNSVCVIEPDKKVLYHCAAVFASNLAVALFETAVTLLCRCGFDRAGAQSALAPLFTYNCRNIAKIGPVNALTGPVERADAETIALHLESLAASSEEKIYADLSTVLVNIAKRKNPERDYSEVIKILQSISD